MKMKNRNLIYIVALILFFIPSTCVSNDTFIQAQGESLKLLNKYQKTSDWKLRLRIKSLKGESEIIASRIFRAFDIISLNAKPCDESEIVNRAWDEINRNPKLSLMVLMPIIREKMSSEDIEKYTGKTSSPVKEDNIELLFQIAINFALAPEGDFAEQVLKALIEDSDIPISEKAKLYFDYYQTQKKNTHSNYKRLNTHSDCFKEWLW